MSQFNLVLLESTEKVQGTNCTFPIRKYRVPTRWNAIDVCFKCLM